MSQNSNKTSRKSILPYFLYFMAVLYLCYTFFMAVSTYNLVITTYAGYGMKPGVDQIILNVLSNTTAPLFFTIALFVLGKMLEILENAKAAIKACQQEADEEEYLVEVEPVLEASEVEDDLPETGEDESGAQDGVVEHDFTDNVITEDAVVEEDVPADQKEQSTESDKKEN